MNWRADDYVTVKVGSLEGAFIANLPSRPFAFGAEVEEPVSDRKGLFPDQREIRDVDRQNARIGRRFLGVEVSADEYDEICRNLTEFFRLLRKWSNEVKP